MDERGGTVSGVEVLVNEDLPLETLRLPRGLVGRVIDIVKVEALGYDDFRGFLLASLRAELKRAERAKYWLREGSSR